MYVFPFQSIDPNAGLTEISTYRFLVQEKDTVDEATFYNKRLSN
jgi:hypothetical protein